MTTATPPLAWHGDPALKAAVVAAMRADREADAIVQGLYLAHDPDKATGYRGCAIGCLVAAQRPELAVEPDGDDEWDWHAETEHLYGIPEAIAYLIDSLFESLPVRDGSPGRFAVEVIEAIPVGADLSMVTSRFVLDVLADADHGVWQHTDDGSTQRAAVEQVADLYRRRLAGDEPDRESWAAAGAAAWAAAGAAARAAAGDAARVGAVAAAGDAARAAAWAAAGDAARAWQAQRLIHHLTTAPAGSNR